MGMGASPAAKYLADSYVFNWRKQTFAVFITGYIVFLLSLARMPGPEIAHRRAFCTAIGGAIALAVRLLVLRRRHRQRRMSRSREAGHGCGFSS